MANRYPFSQQQSHANLAQSTVAGISSINMWQAQPHQPSTVSHQPIHPLQQHSTADEKRQREYLKQQQKLRLMAATTNKQPVNADKLIENLLEKKDIFKPKVSQLSQPIIPGAQISGHPNVPSQHILLAGGGVGSMNYPQQIYPLASRASASLSASEEAVGVPPNRTTPTESGGKNFVLPSSVNKGFQLPLWLSPQSPSLPAFYRHVWSLVAQDNGLVDTAKIFPLLLTSGLPTDVLGYIWSLANQKVAGQLTEDELYVVLALVGLAQSGCTFNNLGVLNLIPQPPIPNLVLATSTQGSEFSPSSLPPLQGKVALEEHRSPPVALESPNPISSLKTAEKESQKEEQPPDEFSDFQSATCSQEPAPVHESPIHIKDSAVSTPTVAFQGVSSSDSHKFSSIFSLGSSSRGIGSRLANHSLGAPKQSKSRHHKHHHHHHHHHHHRNAQPTTEAITAVAEDDFSDFQQAKDPPVLVGKSEELFPKCSPKSPTNSTYVLKESAIRSEKPTENVFFDSPLHVLKAASEREESIAPTPTPLPLSAIPPIPGSSSAQTNVSKKDSSVPPPSVKELLVVEEDKYSALRALSFTDQPPTTSDQPASDDFGDFLSADPVPQTEDSFAALANRQTTPKVDATILDSSSSFWPTAVPAAPQAAEFQVDDWGAFESVPMTAGSSTVPNTAGSVKESLAGLSEALESLSLENTGIDFSVTSMSLKVDQKSNWAAGVLTGSPISNSASDHWAEAPDDHSQTLSADKGGGLTFLGNIYKDHNHLISNSKNDLFVLESAQQADKGSFVMKIEGEEDDEEFGDFMGPETWPDEGKFATKDSVFEGQAVLRIKDSAADTQSVSSLELPVLSRHGSLPSLDLKVFPGDKAGALLPWETSPQGIDHQMKEWSRCVQSCLQLLQAALAVFTGISSDSVVEEVTSAHEGKEYMLNILEVYGICRRVKQSASVVAIDAKLDSLLAEVDMVWSGLEPYFAKADVKFDVEFFCTATADGSQEFSPCGICLTTVGGEMVPENSNNIYPLEYGGQVYHAACANLWVNCVDCRLPALASTHSLL